MFILSKDEHERLEWWTNIHNRTCPLIETPIPKITGRLTYCFTPTINSEIVVVKCACGAEVELTDMDRKWN